MYIIRFVLLWLILLDEHIKIRKMKKIALLSILFLLVFELSSQINKYGVPLIVNYNNQLTQAAEQNWCITKDNFGNLYFGNQDRGIIRYDGTKWSKIQVGSNPRMFSLASDSRGVVYVGAAFEFGYLQPGEKGKNEYISLTNRIDSIQRTGIKNVFSIVEQNGKVYFQSQKNIYVYDIQSDSVSTISLVKYNLNVAFRLIKTKDRLIISDNNEGLFELIDNKITPLPGGDKFKGKICTVLLPFDDNQLLIGTFYDGLFVYNFKTGDVNDEFIDPKINDKLKLVKVYSGTLLKKDLFAIGTTNQEGILIINKSGEIVQQINKENSNLEDNQMQALYCDYENNSELWISTLGTISKVYINIPISTFSEKQGISSGINEICEFNGSFYLSYDAGLLKSYVNSNNNLNFKQVPGINTQIFPLVVIKTPNTEFLLAGSLNGIFQILKNGKILRVEDQIYNSYSDKSQSYNVRKIVQSSIDPNIVFFGLESGGITVLRYEDGRWKCMNRITKIPGLISSIVEKENGGLWFLTDDPSSLYDLTISGQDTTVTKLGPENGVTENDLNTIVRIGKEIYVTGSSGVLRYDNGSGKFIKDNSLTNGFSEGKYTLSLFNDDDGDIWFNGIDKTNVDILFRNKNGITPYRGVLTLLPNVPSLDTKCFNNKIYLLKSKTVYVIDKANLVADTTKVKTTFVRIIAGIDSTVMEGSFYENIENGRRLPSITRREASVPEFKYDMNQISFELTTPYFTEELFTEYSCKLEGLDKEWSKWEGISYGNTMEALYFKKLYSNLPYSRYTFKVRTKTLDGLTGNELSYEFNILKPWYATIVAYLGFALVIFLIIFSIIKAYTQKLKNENIRLEGIVVERTAVVVKQKEELESSIHYASRIQMALLPSEAILSENLKNYFILFKPRDIVSGDFYWMTKKNNRLYVVAADCTGHGVPGAFMSLLGMSFLDEIIDKESSPRADHILSELRLHVTDSLKQVGGDDEAKDGMDMSLLVVDFNVSRIEFSGAYNPCFRVRKMTEDEAKNFHDENLETADGSMSNGKYLLETIYPSKMPIGISSRMNEQFVFYDWNLERGISYYLFSDGYIDQFGGPNGRKFMKKNFKRLILDIQDYPMNKQKEMLEQNLKSWMGQSPQIDDILVMGIRTE
jgi:serine phosphatase RsbU (regulator of sigma subunit)